MTCAACLRELAATRRGGALRPRFWQAGWLVGTVRAGKWLAGLGLAWLFFHLLGHSLLRSTDEFHAEALWEKATGDP